MSYEGVNIKNACMIIGRFFRPYFHFLFTLGHCLLEILTEQPEGTTSTAGKILWGEEISEIHSKGDVGLERGETMKYKAVIFDLDGAFRL